MGALRNMKDPWSSKSPSIYKGFFWNNTSTAYDHGGIHTNCSVGNRFFYLFTERVGLRVSTQVLSDIMFRAPESYEEYARDYTDIQCHRFVHRVSANVWARGWTMVLVEVHHASIDDSRVCNT